MPDVSLSGIEFKIKGSTDSASDSINRLIGNLNSLTSALKGADSIKAFSKSMNSLSPGNRSEPQPPTPDCWTSAPEI